MQRKKRFNIIDILIILFVIAIVFVVFNRKNIKKSLNSSNEIEVNYTVQATDLTMDMLNDLNIGDQLFAQNSLQKANIKNITTSPKMDQSVGSDGILYAVPSEDKITVEVEISGKAIHSGPYISLGGQELKIGIPYILKTEKVEFSSDIKVMEVLE